MSVMTNPAPIGGWNARDALSQMPKTDAVKLINWIPDAGAVVSRGGCVDYCVLTGECETLVEYHSGATRKFLAAAGDKIYDITAPDSVSEIKTGLSNARWQTVQHNDRLIFVNGADAPLVFGGSDFTEMADTNSVGASEFIGCNSFKGRCFYWKADSQDYYYAEAGGFQGKLTRFQLGTVAQQGGNLINMLTWTLDSGSGVDDLAVFVMSSGEALVYQGADPSNANNWSMIGRFNIGQPFAYRGHARLASDEILITRDGYLNISSALQAGRLNPDQHISAKIINAVKQKTDALSNKYGWQICFYPRGNWLIVNVPIETNRVYEQHVYSTKTGQWTKFSGWNARCFGVFNDNLYFGEGGKVVQADIGVSDYGNQINFEAIPAWSHLGSYANIKQLTGIQVVTNYVYPEFIQINASSDFNEPQGYPYVIAPEKVPRAWNIAEWDQDHWAATNGRTTSAWKNVSAAGFAITYNLRITTRAQRLAWYSTSLMFNNAGVV